MIESSSISQRIKDLVLHFCAGNNSKFAMQIGTSEANIRNYINGTSPKFDIVAKIAGEFEINYDWLLTGRGEMLSQYNPRIVYTDGIPLIPISAMAGVMSGDVSVLEIDCERFVVPSFRDADFLIPVKGTSMLPRYSSGDIVACKRLPSDTFFQWNKVYVLDTEQGPLIKRVRRATNPDHLLIVSDNPEYEPFELHVSHIRSLAVVLGSIRLE